MSQSDVQRPTHPSQRRLLHYRTLDTTPLPGEVWKHFKGELYTIVSLGVFEENGLVLVGFRDQSGEVWYSRLMFFIESVMVNGEVIPRFTRQASADTRETPNPGLRSSNEKTP